MPEFVNPFSGLVPRMMTKAELIRALRLNLAAELEAVHLYVAHAEAAEDELANEERQHAGEFLEVIRRLAPDEQQFLDVGRQEVEAMAARLAGAATPTAGAPAAEPATTVGSLRESAKEGT